MQNYSFVFTLVFACTLVVGLLLRFYLATRQIRHVAHNRSTVPAAFAALKLPATDAEALNRLLQELAWDAVIHHPLSGVATR